MNKGQFHTAIENFISEGSYSFAGQYSFEPNHPAAAMPARLFLQSLATYIGYDVLAEESKRLSDECERDPKQIRARQKWLRNVLSYDVPEAIDPLSYGHIESLGEAMDIIAKAEQDGYPAIGSDDYVNAMAKILSGDVILKAAAQKIWERAQTDLPHFSPYQAFERVRPLLYEEKLIGECARVHRAGYVKIPESEAQAVMNIYEARRREPWGAAQDKRIDAIVSLGSKLLKHDAMQAQKDVEHFREAFEQRVLIYRPRFGRGEEGGTYAGR